MRTLLLVFAALVVLSALTLGLSFVPLGGFAVPAALGIGAIKTAFVAWFFMDIRDHGASSRIAFAVALALAAILIVFTALDVATREAHTRAPAQAASSP